MSFFTLTCIGYNDSMEMGDTKFLMNPDNILLALCMFGLALSLLGLINVHNEATRGFFGAVSIAVYLCSWTWYAFEKGWLTL